MSKDRVIFVMVGIPGSGKTTIRENRFEDINNVAIVSSDDYIEFWAKSVGSSYNEVFSTAVKYASEHIDRTFKYALGLGNNIIWDQTNLTVKKRASILNKTPLYYRRVAIFVNTDLEVALSRNSNRDRKILEEVIRKMHSQLEPPSYHEGFDQIIVY